MSLSYGSSANKKKNKKDTFVEELHNLQAKYDEIKKRHDELIKRFRAVYKDNEQIKRRLLEIETQNERLSAQVKYLKLPNGVKQYIRDLKTIKSPFAMREILEKSRIKPNNKLDKILDKNIEEKLKQKLKQKIK